MNDLPDLDSLTVDVEPERDAVHVRPVGTLDLATCPALQAEIAALREAGFKRLVLDLGGLEFMDSTGLRLMLTLDAEARQDGFTFALVRGNAAVQRVFELTGTTDLLPFTDA